MTKRGIILCIISLLLLGYLVAALIYSSKLSAADRYKGLQIDIANSEGARFVNSEDIDFELGGLKERIARMPKDSVNTLAIERRLLQMDNIEDVNCVVLNNGIVHLDVMPLQPVARVFDSFTDSSYYINRAGKRMRASTRYRVDVPVITGNFSGKHDPSEMLPVVEYADAHGQWRHFASSYHLNSKGDIIIIPIIQGHVVNFGDTCDIASKFARLETFYREVMPAKGWEYYDTITVKWGGQIVAKIHEQRHEAPKLIDDLEEYIDDPGTMGLTEELADSNTEE